MSNLDRVRRGYEAFQRGDTAAVLEFIDPEIEVREPGGGVEPGVRHGREGFIESIRNMQAVWDDFRLELDEALDLADRVLALVRVSGRGRLDGVPIEAKSRICGPCDARKRCGSRYPPTGRREWPSVDACPTASTVHLAAELPRGIHSPSLARTEGASRSRAGRCCSSSIKEQDQSGPA